MFNQKLNSKTTYIKYYEYYKLELWLSKSNWCNITNNLLILLKLKLMYTTTATTSEIREIITQYPTNIPYNVQPTNDTGIKPKLKNLRNLQQILQLISKTLI